jgi:cell division transport system permease protein
MKQMPLLFARALRGVRQQLGTQLLSVMTVGLALFCMAAALLALENAGAMVQRWGAPVRVTVFLAEGATGSQTEALRSALAALPEVSQARYVTSAEARATLGQGGDRAIANAPVELFPATIELQLAPAAVTRARVAALADRVRRVPMVADVETYRGFTDRLRDLLSSGRAAVVVMSLGVLLTVLAVVSNTIRMSLAARVREIEVLRLVGATREYVRTPFLLEGAMLGGLGAAAALFALSVVFYTTRARFEETLGAALGLHPVFLSAWVFVGFLIGGGALGAAGSAAALRRGLQA